MADQPKPNILFVTTDQQRFDTCGSFAPSWMRTPHYEDLRNQGIEFTRAYSDCPICVPSRISMMTGKQVFTHGMAGNGKTSTVMGREGTLPTLLRELGYQTAAIGKMHFGPQRVRHGFDEMILPEDYYIQMRNSGSPLQPMHHGLGQNELYAGMATVPESMTLTSWIAEQCVSYIRDRRDPSVPFFLWCSFSKPHPPLDPPEPYYSMYRDCDIPEPSLGRWSQDANCPATFRQRRMQHSFDRLSPQIIREARAAYLGLITQIDYNLGRVLAALQGEGLFNDTLILYTSDHGEFLGDHRSGSKVFFHESSAHVPMLLRLPKSWEDRRHGSQCDALVTCADVLPTLVKAAGGDVPAGLDGQDMTALARGQQKPREYLEASGTNQKGIPTHLSITDGRFKYMYYPQGAQEQLFDLQADPKEANELLLEGKGQEHRDRLRDELLRRLRERNSPFLQEGELPTKPISGMSEADFRDTSWPGYHLESQQVDTRH